MSTTIGIITEFNPLHSGHQYLISEIRKKFGDDCRIVTCMSGNFTQRGIPALLSKWDRALLAIKSGINLVIELPTLFATASAEKFAFGGINTLLNTGMVDVIAFGSESGDLSGLKTLAENYLLDEKNNINRFLLKKNKGQSYAKTLSQGTSSNDILGAEYIKSLILRGAKQDIFLVERKGAEYNSNNLDALHPSATSIRKYFYENKGLPTSSLPENLQKEYLELQKSGKLLDASKHSIYDNNLIFLLRRMNYDELIKYRYVDESLANIIRNNVQKIMTGDELLYKMKSKNYVFSRLTRSLASIYLGVTKEFEKANSSIEDLYIRPLAADEFGFRILSEMKKKALSPIIYRIGRCPGSLLRLDISAGIHYDQLFGITTNEYKKNIRREKND